MLQEAFPGTSHVALEKLETVDDDRIWEFAKVGGLVITTKDEDFQVLSFARGHPPKVVWLKSGNGPTEQVLEILLRARVIIDAFGADSDRSLLMLP
jgi:predicted nuclease of predicted toxin-antitoxin system